MLQGRRPSRLCPSHLCPYFPWRAEPPLSGPRLLELRPTVLMPTELIHLGPRRRGRPESNSSHPWHCSYHCLLPPARQCQGAVGQHREVPFDLVAGSHRRTRLCVRAPSLSNQRSAGHIQLWLPVGPPRCLSQGGRWTRQQCSSCSGCTGKAYSQTRSRPSKSPSRHRHSFVAPLSRLRSFPPSLK